MLVAALHRTVLHSPLGIVCCLSSARSVSSMTALAASEAQRWRRLVGRWAAVVEQRLKSGGQTGCVARLCQ